MRIDPTHKIPLNSALSQLFKAVGMILVATALAGCHASEAPAPAAISAAGSNSVATSSAASNRILQQVESDPNVPADKKVQITDSLTRSQQAANDPRAMRGRPSATATP